MDELVDAVFGTLSVPRTHRPRSSEVSSTQKAMDGAGASAWHGAPGARYDVTTR